MRVIAGTHRGRVLKGPRGPDTRPITDRVKESLFNILAGRVAAAVVADCFCGTGSLGIEALSRGASAVLFAEIDGSALRLLRANLEALGLTARATIRRYDVLRKGLPANAERGGRNGRECGIERFRIPHSAFGVPFSLVFLDPPYRITEAAGGRLWVKLDQAADAGLLAPDATVVWRHDARFVLEAPPESADRWTLPDRRRYGSQALTFLRPANAD